MDDINVLVNCIEDKMERYPNRCRGINVKRKRCKKCVYSVGDTSVYCSIRIK